MRDPMFRKILDNAEEYGSVAFICDANDISCGNPKLNLLFTASIYHATLANRGDMDEQEMELPDEVMETREERQYKNWINSMGIPGVHVNSIFTDLYNGLILLKVLDRVEPGCVDWRQTEKNPNNIFKLLINGGACIKTGKNKLNFKLFNCDADSIVKKDRKMTIAFLWQLMRYHSIKCAEGYDEKALLKWANSVVPSEVQVKRFNAKSLKNSKFFFALLEHVFEIISK